MRKIKIYSVVSAEGYACGNNGDVDWLVDTRLPGGIEYGVKQFFGNIGEVVMTREFYSTMYGCELCFNFLEKPCIIIRSDLEGVITASGDFEYVPLDEGFSAALERVSDLKSTEGGDIWIAGGIDLVYACIEAGLVDEIVLIMLPVSIGSGIRLFPASFNESNWNCTTIRKYDNGAIQMLYRSNGSSHGALFS